MNKSLVFVVLLSVILALIGQTFAVKCYQCTGTCTGSETSTNCTIGDTCMKTYLGYPGGSLTMRMCTYSSACTTKSYGIFGWGFWSACCTTDGCNSASPQTPTILFILGACLASLMAFIKL